MNEATTTERPFLDRAEAAEFLTSIGLPIAKSTLEKMAVRGDGPAFESWGRYPRYRRDVLLAWAESRLSGPRKSTSDPGARNEAA